MSTPAVTNPNLFPPEEVVRELEQQGDANTAFGDKSPGVRRIEAIAKCMTRTNLWTLWISIFVVAYAYGLDATIRGALQYYAVTDLKKAAQISTVTVVRSIVAAAVQPSYAKISDYFGRGSILVFSVVFYVVGTILESAAQNLGTFVGGSILNQIGFTGIRLLLEVLIADTTPLKNRLVFTLFPALPSLINAWIAPNVTNTVLGGDDLVGGPGWRWGYAMWCIIFPICNIPLFWALWAGENRAKKAGMYDDIPSNKSLLSPSLWGELFWQLDVIGILLMAAHLVLLLLPFTLYGGNPADWKQAKAITPIVVSLVLCLPMFIIWEAKFAKHPAVPFRLLKDRQIILNLALSVLMTAAWYCQGDYMYNTLIVAFHQTIKQAGYISNIYSFVSTIVGTILGLVIRKVRRLKWFMVFGTSLSIVAFGLIFRFRSAEDGGVGGLVAAEVMLGFSFGFFAYPCQTLLQAAVQHERVAMISALYLVTFSIGAAAGNSIAAGIWLNKFPAEAARQMAAIGANSTVADYLYTAPLQFVVAYPVGTPERTAAMQAYAHLQKLLCIAGLCLSALMFLITLFLRNPYLGEEQSIPDAEGFVLHGNATSLPRDQYSVDHDDHEDRDHKDRDRKHRV